MEHAFAVLESRSRASWTSLAPALGSEPRNRRFYCAAAAALIHAAVLFGGGAALYQPAEYGMQGGIGSVDVDLVAGVAAAERLPEQAPPVEQPPPAEARAEFAAPEPAPAESDRPRGASASVASAEAEGALWAEPKYFRNRPPRYPAAALAAGIEGTVIVMAEIDDRGRPVTVRVETSSGDASLDAAALTAVRRWTFNPARVGSMPVASRSRIPVRFQIQR